MKPFFQNESRGSAQSAKKEISYLFLSVCLAAVLSFLLPQAGYTDDISWNIYPCHFDGVDNQGNVFLIQKMGELELSQGRQLPVYALFSSDGHNSPFVGYGWRIPLLESTFVQMDDNLFMAYLPNGTSRMFNPDKKDASLLKSSRGWRAKIREKTITASSWYGRSKFVFCKGRIVSMKVKEGNFDLDFAMWDFGKPVSLEIPTDAELFNPFMLLGGLPEMEVPVDVPLE